MREVILVRNGEGRWFQETPSLASEPGTHMFSWVLGRKFKARTNKKDTQVSLSLSVLSPRPTHLFLSPSCPPLYSRTVCPGLSLSVSPTLASGFHLGITFSFCVCVCLSLFVCLTAYTEQAHGLSAQHLLLTVRPGAPGAGGLDLC